MTNLLLITDIPRLRTLFSRFKDEQGIHLRIASNLEKGGEELVADKPSMVFVQTHLSGLSADILLKHLKKLLGRKRSRFVLLSPPDQVSDEVLNLYQGHLDTSLDDNSLSDAIRDMISAPSAKGKPVDSIMEAAAASPAIQQAASVAEPVTVHDDAAEGEQLAAAPTQPEPTATLALPQFPESNGPSLEEQGITYAPRPRISVYSEFTSSFDNAVSSMEPPEPADDSRDIPRDWTHEHLDTIESAPTRSKRVTFLLWLVPVLVVVVIITMLQQRKPRTGTTIEPAPANKVIVTPPAAPTASVPTTPAPAPSAKPAAQPPAVSTETAVGDRAVMSAIAENRGAKGAPGNARLTELPDFIPRTGFDKQYSAANPGWERYKGHTTEFKVYREGASIKAIQVIDRGGKGVPESFMKAVLKQVSKNPAFVQSASERKEGYEIQRGQVADNLKVVFYRDEQGGTIRAFVLTWQ